MNWLQPDLLGGAFLLIMAAGITQTDGVNSRTKAEATHDKYHDNEPAQNQLGIFPCWLSITRTRGVSYSTTLMLINKLFISEEDLANYEENCKGNVTEVGKDHLGLDVRTEDCTITDTAVIQTMTMSTVPGENEFFDLNVTHKQVIVKPFIDKETGETCMLGGGWPRKFFGSVKQARFPEDEEYIFALDDIGPQAAGFFEDVIDPKLIYQGTEMLGNPGYKCLLEILRGNNGVTVETLRKMCPFDCSSAGQKKTQDRIEL